MTNELKFELVIRRDIPALSETAISFETGASPAYTQDRNFYAYEHHGDGFPREAPGALSRFYEDLILGRALPLRFETRAINDIDTVLAILLFMHRDLAIHPAMPSLVAAVEGTHRLGIAFACHLESDLERFFRLLRGFFPSDLSKQDTASRLATALEWLGAYVTKGELPHLGSEVPVPRVLDKGTNGFVVAEVDGPLGLAWVSLYRQGYLRGVLVGPETSGRRQVLAARKSTFLPFDLSRAALQLNEMESAMGEPSGWRNDELWLRGPDGGTTILMSHLMEVLLRV